MNGEKEDLEEELRTRDPQLYARTDRSTKKRMVRALEIALTKDRFPDTLPVQGSLLTRL